MNRIIVLGIDAALDQCGIALLKGADIFVDCSPMRRGHAEVLVPKIIGLLKQADVGFSDLSLIAVTTGPGSFTGLRTGLATAKGLSMAGCIPLAGFKTFEVLAYAFAGPEQEKRNLLVAIDSLRDDVYCQLYDAARTEIKPAGTFMPDEILDYTGKYPLTVIGNGSGAFKKILNLHHPNVIFKEVDAGLAPQTLCKRGELLLPRAYKEADLDLCRPFYLRPPDVTLPK